MPDSKLFSACEAGKRSKDTTGGEIETKLLNLTNLTNIPFPNTRCLGLHSYPVPFMNKPWAVVVGCSSQDLFLRVTSRIQILWHTPGIGSSEGFWGKTSLLLCGAGRDN